MDVDLHSDTVDLPHSQWLQRMRQYVHENRDRLQTPVLKKGDVLFWNSRTIHGAIPRLTQNFLASLSLLIICPVSMPLATCLFAKTIFSTRNTTA